MTIINFDSLMTLKKTFVIAGKDRDVLINDKTIKEIADVQTKIMALSVDLENQSQVLDNQKDAEKIYTEGAALVDQLVNQTREISTGLFDNLFGEGVGQEIYAFYGESTQALSFIINSLYDEIQITQDNNKTTKKQKNQKKR